MLCKFVDNTCKELLLDYQLTVKINIIIYLTLGHLWQSLLKGSKGVYATKEIPGEWFHWLKNLMIYFLKLVNYIKWLPQKRYKNIMMFSEQCLRKANTSKSLESYGFLKSWNWSYGLEESSVEATITIHNWLLWRSWQASM